MTGLCPEGGCRQVSRVPATNGEGFSGVEDKGALFVDFFSQARKALCVRSPFDVPDGGTKPSTSAASTVTGTLPSALGSLLKQSDGRKRHKKSHSTGADKTSLRASERSKGGNIWVETEEYFRELTMPDIDILSELSSSIKNLGSSKYLLVPFSENEEDAKCNNIKVNSEAGVSNVNGVSGEDQEVEIDLVEPCNGTETHCGHTVCSVQQDAVEPECLSQDEEMEGDCLDDERGRNVISVSSSSSGVNWILACRNRALLTSERPSKKRKLLGSDARLEKVLIGSPCEGNSLICDYCCKSDMGDASNRLIVCTSCKVAVHINCYGIQGEVDEIWLCSWCKQKSNGYDTSKKPCLLCPKQGGALKPVGTENDESVREFAHLFCSVWMPEVYIEDLSRMEPIMKVEGIDTKRKLVCNICKLKSGFCVRCSNGTCRSAFHPICARESRQKLEVYGKYGCDNVELRVFCSKHSELPDGRSISRLEDHSVGISSDFAVASGTPARPVDKEQKLDVSHTGVEETVRMQTETNSDKLCDNQSLETGSSDSKINAVITLECGDLGEINTARLFEKAENKSINSSDTLNVSTIIKKLMDRGKINAKSLTSELGISVDLITSMLDEGSLIPEVECKIVKWLRNHAYFGSLCQNAKVLRKSASLSKTEMVAADCSGGTRLSESAVADPVSVKSVPPRIRTQSNIRILRSNKIICNTKETSGDNGVVMSETKGGVLLGGEPENSIKASIPNSVEKSSIGPDNFHESLVTEVPKCEASSDCMSDGCTERMHTPSTNDNNAVDPDEENLVLSDAIPRACDPMKSETLSGLHVHPLVQKRLLELDLGPSSSNNYDDCDGEVCRPRPSSDASVCCDHWIELPNCSERSVARTSNQLPPPNNLGIFELSPTDEVEGEILYFQQKLLDKAVSRKHLTDNLIAKVAESLPQEIDVAKMQRWDAVLVNQYLSELRKAKKQGRKERRYKEAQSVLAAATAAAAASSRVSSLRKDAFDDAYHEKLNTSNGRAGISSQPMHRLKDTRLAGQRISSEIQPLSDSSKEQSRSCDICRRSETILNPILICFHCKVAVHLDCYRSVRETSGPWYCEWCEESLSKCTGSALNFSEKPSSVTECGLCGGTSGAFRKATNGQWVHAFCAEWILEQTFRRGQVNPVEGMDAVANSVDICCICHCKRGLCIKCSYGHCHTTFHPSCAAHNGLFMSVKSLNGKLQHKAYCEKHSLEQRAKAETQKHGAEDLKRMKQVRVELERLRLLCERIVKREKIKRDLVVCSHGILACKRDHVARSMLLHAPFFPSEVSSDSATTSVRTTDDVTVDSTVSCKRRAKVTLSMDTDQKTKDSNFTSQNTSSGRPPQRVPFAGKKMPQKASLATCVPLDDGECTSKTRKTFEKELIMTSDQASMKNQRLPKGYFYIPVDCLRKEKQVKQDGSDEPLEHDG